MNSDLTASFRVLCALVLGIASACGSPTQCQRKYFNQSSFVCVCNATYCDTIDTDVSPPKGEVLVFSTSKAGDRFKRSSTGLKSSATVPNDGVLIKVNISAARQTIIGFGGTFTDAAGMNIADLPKDAQTRLINSYFSPEGIEYSLGRIPVASNDFSTDIYSYDFTPGDTYLSKFTIAGYDHIYKLPYIDQAVVASRRNVSLFASPWSSPDWMKNTDNMVGNGTVASDMKKVYANYLGRFLREYESFMFHGRMWGMTAQNNPETTCINGSDWQAMCWSANETKEWIADYLGPSLKDYGYEHIKLMILDDDGQFLPEWADTFEANETALDYMSGFAIHAYDNDTDPSILDTVSHNFPDKFILSTEFCERLTAAVVLGSWERGEDYARRIFQDLNHSVAGWTDYNLALDMNGGPSWVKHFCDSPVIVDKDAGVFYKQPTFYILGHFSKFLPPGSKIVSHTLVQGKLNEVPVVAAVTPENNTVVEAMNLYPQTMNVFISDGYNIIENMMEEYSIQTFIWQSTPTN